MPQRNFHLHDGKMGAAIAVRVTPRASRNKIVEILSDVLNTPKSRLEIVAGVTGRDKLISVLDMDAETVHQRIVAHLD